MFYLGQLSKVLGWRWYWRKNTGAGAGAASFGTSLLEIEFPFLDQQLLAMSSGAGLAG